MFERKQGRKGREEGRMEEREREKEGRKEVCQLNNSFVPNFIFTFVILCPLFWSFCSTVCMIYSRK